MIDKKELEKLIAKYDKQYQTNYMNYQETGITRYSTAYHKAEDMADALRMALDAKANNEELRCLRVQLANWRGIIERMGKTPDPQSVKGLLEEISCMAKLHGC